MISHRLVRSSRWLTLSVALVAALAPVWSAAAEVSWPIIRVDGTTVWVWGRAHRMGGNGLPESIVSQGRELLAGPVVWRVNDEAGPVAGECRFDATADDHVAWEARGRFPAVDYRCRGVAEPDGMLRFDVEFVPREPLRPLSLRLEMPIRRDQATLLHFFPPLYEYPQITWTRIGRPNSLARPAGWHSPFTPFVWLGSEERGLQWFCESDEGWRPAEAGAALQIVETDGAAVLRVHLIDSPVVLDGPFRLTFGLMAGPVKPHPATFRQGRFGYRHWGTYDMAETVPAEGPPPASRLEQLKANGVRFIGLHEEWTDFEGMPRPSRPEDLRRLVEAVHRHGMGLVLYHSLAMPDIVPEFATMSDEYLCEPRSAHYVHPREPAQHAYTACPRSGWADRLADGVARLFDDYGIDGVYLDGPASLMWCANERHGCGYVAPDGTRRPTYAIFATRELMRRLDRIRRNRPRPTLIVAHMSGMVTLPTLSFADVLLTGEQWWTAARLDEAPDFRLPLAAFRAECMGHPHGLPTHFIGYPPLGGEWARTMTGLHHAASPWCPGATEMWRLYDAFDADGAQWRPYWHEHPVAAADCAEVRVSAFVHPGRRALLAVGNTGRADVTTQLRLDEAAVGPGWAARDALTGDTIPRDDGRLAIGLAAESLRWIWLEAIPEERNR